MVELIDPEQWVWVYQHQQQNLSSTDTRNSIPKAVSKEVGTDCIQHLLLAWCPTMDFAYME